jgi:hypothetical protein
LDRGIWHGEVFSLISVSGIGLSWLLEKSVNIRAGMAGTASVCRTGTPI